MRHRRITPSTRTLMQLAHRRLTGVLDDGRLYNILIEQHGWNPPRFWTRVHFLTQDEAVRAEFPETCALIERRAAGSVRRGSAVA